MGNLVEEATDVMVFTILATLIIAGFLYLFGDAICGIKDNTPKEQTTEAPTLYRQ